MRICGSRRPRSPPARLKLGRGGFTITAKDGAVTSEVGELELCGGSAEGRLSLDLAAPTKPLNLVANLTDVALDSCLTPLGLEVPLRGTGGLKAELATEGNDTAELTRNLTGTLKVKAHDGAVPVDFARLVAATSPLDGNGWSLDAHQLHSISSTPIAVSVPAIFGARLCALRRPAAASPEPATSICRRRL